jgi:hypothetical protein
MFTSTQHQDCQARQHGGGRDRSTWPERQAQAHPAQRQPPARACSAVAQRAGELPQRDHAEAAMIMSSIAIRLWMNQAKSVASSSIAASVAKRRPLASHIIRPKRRTGPARRTARTGAPVRAGLIAEQPDGAGDDLLCPASGVRDCGGRVPAACARRRRSGPRRSRSSTECPAGASTQPGTPTRSGRTRPGDRAERSKRGHRRCAIGNARRPRQRDSCPSARLRGARRASKRWNHETLHRTRPLDHPNLAPGHPRGARRHVAFRAGRDERGNLPDLGLLLRRCPHPRRTLCRRGSGHDLRPHAEPDRADAGRTHRADGGCRGLPRPGDRHGGDDCGDAVPAFSGRPHGDRPRRVRTHPLGYRQPAAALRHPGQCDRRDGP